MDESGPARRQVVIPGELLDGRGLKPGSGTYSEGDQIFAAHIGIRQEREGFVDVVPLSGRYIPRARDAVVGQVIDLGPSHWLTDINSPYPAPLHATESPWRVEFGDTERFLRVGDAIIAGVLSVDEAMHVQLTMADQQYGRLQGGQIIEIPHVRVPRVIGQRGTMIAMIRDFTRVEMFVGQNGRIWLDGSPTDVGHAVHAIHLIEERAPLVGLTDTVREYLVGAYGRGAAPPTGRN